MKTRLLQALRLITDPFGTCIEVSEGPGL